MNTARLILLTVLGIIAAFLAFTTLGLFGLSWDRFARGYVEETRTQTYENSRAYIQGTAKDVADICRQWRSEEDEIIKKAIAETLVARLDRFDIDRLPSFQRQCATEIYRSI